MTTPNRFDAYIEDVRRQNEDTADQIAFEAEQARSRKAQALANAERIKHANQKRRQTNEGTQPIDLWGPEAAALCADFIDFAIRSSGVRRNLIGARYMRGKDPSVEYVSGYTGLFSKKPIIRTRSVGIGWRTSGYPIAFSAISRQEVETTQTEDPLKAPEPDVYLCKDGLVRHDDHPLDLEADGSITQPIFPEWKREHSTRKERVYEARHEYDVIFHTYRLDYTELDPVRGLHAVLQNHALAIREGELNNVPDRF